MKRITKQQLHDTFCPKHLYWRWQEKRKQAKIQKPTYEIITDKDTGSKGITCLDCGLTSYNEHDIEQKYCGNCHEFHELKKFRNKLRAEDEKSNKRQKQINNWMRAWLIILFITGAGYGFIDHTPIAGLVESIWRGAITGFVVGHLWAKTME